MNEDGYDNNGLGGVASNEAGLSSLRDVAASASPPKASIPNAGCTVPMDHPLVKALNKAVREKQEAREREERRVYVDPRDIRFVMGGS